MCRFVARIASNASSIA
uniref:BLTX721 n=1 Tax=Nephila pilipes TaxID=299642 RepID=A0A076L343_NEPPI|nr:BLTX721 [Nephila pilipes]